MPTILKSLRRDVEALQRDSRAKREQLHAWFKDYLEGQLELTDEVKAKLNESHREIAAGDYTIPQAG